MTRPGSVGDPAFLEQYAATHRFRLGRPGALTLTPDGQAVLFLRSPPRSFERELLSFHIPTRTEQRLFRAEDLLGGQGEVLTEEELARRERMRSADRGIHTYALSGDTTRLLIPLSGRLFVVNLADRAVVELPDQGGPAIDPRLSPDGKNVAVVRDGDLWVIDVESRTQRRLTQRESAAITYGLAEYVAQEEMSRYHGFWWAPDSRQLLVQRTDVSGVERMYIADPLHPEREPRSWPYPRAGQANAEIRLGVLGLEGGAIRWLEWDQRRWPYLASVRWDRGAPITLVVQDRQQQEVALLRADPASGQTAPLWIERDASWINLDQEVPRWLPDGSAFVWTSERSGAWQLELRGSDGALIAPLTPADFGYAGLITLDPSRGQAWVRAAAEPSETHLWRVPLDPSRGPPRRMTHEPGQHSAVVGRGEWWIHTLHTLDGAHQVRLERIDGGVVAEIPSAAETPPFIPTLHIRRLGPEPGLQTLTIRPRDHRPGRRYPVVVAVYGGPHAQMVSASPLDYLLQQWIADQGFVVISIDGRGTPRRGRLFERAIRGDFLTHALEDQVTGLRAILAQEPGLDGSRVGIYGWSFGGYLAAGAALLWPDVFAAAVAGAPVTDWLDYDTHYTERYLGLPDRDPEAYHRSSLLPYAGRLRRPLLIIHGTSDDNVYFSHSIKLSDALFRAGKPHQLLPLAGFTHMVPDPLVTRRLYQNIVDFFLEHLGGPT